MARSKCARQSSLDLEYPQPCHPERSEGSAFARSTFLRISGRQSSRVLYTGITNNLERRLREHRLGETEGFTKRYRVHRRVCFECYRDVRAAIAREKQIKG
jgi:predicted GIY-YIG superfamily endonuclease